MAISSKPTCSPNTAVVAVVCYEEATNGLENIGQRAIAMSLNIIRTNYGNGRLRRTGHRQRAEGAAPDGSERIVGEQESAGLNRHVVGDERALQERKQRIHPGLESCRRYREITLEA